MEENKTFERGTGFGGKFTSLPKGYRAKLSAPMPDGAIKPHPTKTFLSTIKAIFIVERLNDVFGIMGWELEHYIQGENPEYVTVGARIYIREFDLYTSFQYGGHTLVGKNTEPADGYKSSVTDALSKCASLLEIGIQVFKGVPKSKVANTSVKVATPEPKPEEKKPAAKKPAAKKPTVKKPAKAEVKADPLKDAINSIHSYVDADSLKVDAQKIVDGSGISDEKEVAELKKAINDTYMKLTLEKA